ncbi:MAG: sel1 repeat family protein [Gammaproteobacteria bacterium]|nr:sel1 repeat family protein [Gammaproteobacteria bacterium]MCP5135828.1 sel1 repeat family protein [Gammaproteobacteria bacterium]
MNLHSGIAAFESKHFNTAIPMLKPFAEEGHPGAMYRMAIMAQNGLGMVKDAALAARYMLGAAEAGEPLAMHGIGFMYMEGDCVEQSGEKALEWFTKAANEGLVGSMTTIAMMYHQGTGGVAADLEKAKEWYTRAGFDEML